MKLNMLTFSLTASLLLLSACSSTDDVCEDVTVASEQIQECQILHRKIVNAKKDPIIRTELERRYQLDCIDIRYYREDQQVAICGNKEEIKEVREKAIDGKTIN